LSDIIISKIEIIARGKGVLGALGTAVVNIAVLVEQSSPAGAVEGGIFDPAKSVIIAIAERATGEVEELYLVEAGVLVPEDAAGEVFVVNRAKSS